MVEPIHYKYPQKTINIEKSNEKIWEKVHSTFIDFYGDALSKYFKNTVGTNSYTDNSNRKNNTEIKNHICQKIYIFVYQSQK